MEDTFELPVLYKGKELLFPASLHQSGYTHRFQVIVDGVPVQFESDEEGAYRALVSGDDLESHIDKALLQAIAESIASVLK